MIGDDTATVRIWDLSPLQQKRSVPPSADDARPSRLHELPHAGALLALILSADDRFLATASADGVVRVWDVEGGTLLNHVSLAAPCSTIVFRADTSMLALLDTNGHVFLWHWQQKRERWWRKQGQQLLALPQGSGSINDLAWSPDDRSLATAGDDTRVLIWDIEEFPQAQVLPHPAPVTHVCYEPEQTLATGCGDGGARVWNLQTREMRHCIPHAGPLQALVCNPRRSYLATLDESGRGGIWKIREGSSNTYQCHSGTITHLAFTPYRHLRVVSEEQERVYIWNISADKELLYTFEKHEGYALARDGRQVTFLKGVRNLFSPDGTAVAQLQQDGTVRIFQTPSALMNVLPLAGKEITTWAFSSDGQYLALAERGKTVQLWQWQTNSVHTLSYDAPIHTLAFSADDTLLVTVDEAHRVVMREWRTATATVLLTLPHEDRVHILALSPDGKVLLTVSSDAVVRLWNVATAERMHPLSHKDRVTAAIFSSDGRFIATASTDGTAGIWETSSGKRLAELSHPGKVHHITFSQDDTHLATASDDGTICIWLWRPEDLISLAKARLTTNLTREEWHDSIGDEPYRKTFFDLGWRETPPDDPF